MEFRYSGSFVRDVPSTVAFYQKAFGLGLRYMHPSNGYAELETGATLLAFVSEAFSLKLHQFAGIFGGTSRCAPASLDRADEPAEKGLP